MYCTESVSKGCFPFKPSSGNSKKSKSKVEDPLDFLSSEVWYKAYTDVWSKIEKNLETLEDTVSEKLLTDLVQFISDSTTGKDTIPTATLLTGVNLPDHDSLFGRMAVLLREKVTSHIAHLRASDCPSLKNIIEQMTGQFMRKLDDNEDVSLLENEDEDEIDERWSDVKRSECTMPNLVKWYSSAECPSPVKRKKLDARPKLVIVIPEFEAFPSKLLHDFILILSGYASRLPLVIVLGVATTVSALNNSLPHKVTSKLSIQLFQSQPSIYFLNNTLDKVFLTSECPFQLGPKVFKFLTDVFLFYDFSVNGFTQGIKYCVMQHFYEKPASVLCCSYKKIAKRAESLSKEQLEAIRQLISFRKYVESREKPDQIALLTSNKYLKTAVVGMLQSLHEKIFHFHTCLKLLHILVSQLPQAPLGKQLRELYCNAICGGITETSQYKECFQLLGFQAKDELIAKYNQMLVYLNSIEKESEWLERVKGELKEAKSVIKRAGINSCTKSPLKSPTKVDLNVKNRAQLRQKLCEMGKAGETSYEKSRRESLDHLMNGILKEGLQPLNRHYLHELVVCDNAANIRRRVVGTPRAALHTALNNPHHYLQCECCSVENPSEIKRNMPDMCIAYKLHLESGALINMYDWLVAFATIIDPESALEDRQVDPEIQARFTQAVAELEFLGFVKSSQRKTDHVARLTWGGTL